MKPVLVGLNNPHSADPRDALRASPINSAGHRLATMFVESGRSVGLDTRLVTYEDAFERHNILDATDWDDELAFQLAPKLLGRLSGKTVVCCGIKTLKLLQLPRVEWMEWREPTDSIPFRYSTIPHPSGLTRLYNDPFMRRQVGDFLLKLYMET